MSAPAFTPEPSAAGACLLFILFDAEQPVRAAMTAACHSDDFDDLLALIPPEAAGWHILSSLVGHLVGGSEAGSASEPGPDRAFPTILPPGAVPAAGQEQQRRRLDRFLGFAEAPGKWGAWSIIGTSDDPEALVAAGATQLIDLETSEQIVGGEVVSIIPSFEQIEEHQDAIAEYQLERAAHGDDLAPPSTEDIAKQRMMQNSVLPDGWESLPVDQLREVVQAAEEAIGKSPDELAKIRANAERAVDEMGLG